MIGLACFSHDFGSLDGKVESVTKIFDSTPERNTSNDAFILLADVFPVLVSIPTARNRFLKELEQTMAHILEVVLRRNKGEKEAEALHMNKSMIGLLGEHLH